jgi:hypothetical protein
MNKRDALQLREALRLLLQRLADDRRSSTVIAHDAGVSQPTVSRMRRSRGRRLRWSGPFNKLCTFYRIPLAGPGTTGRSYNDLLREAIIDAWDGTNERGQALLILIRNLRGLIKPMRNRGRDSRGNH